MVRWQSVEVEPKLQFINAMLKVKESYVFTVLREA